MKKWLYYGEKPSVDTPIQIKLFNYYHNVNYMVHGHVYVDNAKMTEHKIPLWLCGKNLMILSSYIQTVTPSQWL